MLNQKRLICWAKEVCKWVRWNISYPELSTHRCLISHISDWTLLRCHARLKKPSCHSARWSQCDIFSTKQTKKWDGNICTKHFLHPVSPPAVRDPLCLQRPSSACSLAPRNEAWHRQRAETKQGPPALEHGRLLITAKIGPGVPSHLLHTGAGGWLPRWSAHRSLCT